MVGTHEQNIHHDTQGDEQLREGIKNNDRKNLKVRHEVMNDNNNNFIVLPLQF